MMTVRPFSRKGFAGFFDNPGGSAAIWLVAGICFVIVFLGVFFLLLKDNAPDRTPPPVPAVSKRQVREPIKPYTAPDKALSGTEKAHMKPEITPPKETAPKETAPKETAAEPVEPAAAPLKADASKIQDVLPDDAPGEGILAKNMNKEAPKLPAEADQTKSAPASPPAKAEPPAVSEKTEVSENELPAVDEKATIAEPSKDSAGSAEKATEPVENREDVKSKKTGSKEPKELTVAVLQGNVRRGPSVKDEILFRIAHGDKVQEIDREGNWYAVRLDDGRSGWAHRSLFKAGSIPSKASLKVPSETVSASTKRPKKGGVIKGIRTVVTDPNHAQIIFELDGYFPPEITVIEGKAPRIVCDFFSAGLAPDVRKRFSVTTDVVKQVRVGVHKEPKPKIRVVLDLNPGQNYAVEQFFFEKESYYALMISSAK